MRYANNLTNQIKEYFPDRKLEVAFEWLPKDASVLMFKDARKSPGYNRQLWSSFFIDLYTGNPKTGKPETGNRNPESESGIRNRNRNRKPETGIRNPESTNQRKQMQVLQVSENYLAKLLSAKK